MSSTVNHINKTTKYPLAESPVSSQDVSQRLLQSFKKGDFYKLGYFGFKTQFAKDLETIDPIQLKLLLDNLFAQLSNEKKADPLKTLHRIAQVIPLEKLQKAIATQYPKHENALKTAQSMFRQAKYALEKSETNVSPTLRARFSALLDSLIVFLESILQTFGIGDFFKSPQNEFEASMKSQKIMMIFHFFMLLSSTFIAIFGEATGGLVLAGTLGTISVLSLIYPYIKPMPPYLPKFTNLTKQIQQKEIKVIGGRKSINDQIGHTLIASKKATNHVMLDGQSGIGKTHTAESFTEAVLRGDYPELKDKTIFYGNAAEFINNSSMFGGGNPILENLSKEMGRHRDRCVLIFDESHLFCQPNQNGQAPMGDQLKTRLDNKGQNGFPFVICMTTEEEFYRDIWANNPAFARRFKRINIESTNLVETMGIMSDFILQQAPESIVADGSLKYLYERSNEAFSKKITKPLIESTKIPEPQLPVLPAPAPIQPAPESIEQNARLSNQNTLTKLIKQAQKWLFEKQEKSQERPPEAVKIIVPEVPILPIVPQKEAPVEQITMVAPQPLTARNILSRCINKTEDSQKSPLELKVETLRSEIQSSLSQLAIAQDSFHSEDQTEHSKIAILENELEKLEKEFKKELEDKHHLFQTKDTLAKVKEKTNRTILKVANLAESKLTSKNKKDLNEFLLLSHVLIPSLKTQIQTQAKELNVKTVIDKALIDEVIREELDMKEKSDAAAKRGKTQLAERTK